MKTIYSCHFYDRKKWRQGGKGESAKASQASVVPQTNWKQCVWKSGSYSGTDNGKIKVYVNGIRIIHNTPNEIHSFSNKIFSRRTSPHSSMEFFQTNTICQHIA